MDRSARRRSLVLGFGASALRYVPVVRFTNQKPTRNAAMPNPKIRGLGPSGPATRIASSSAPIPSSCSPRPTYIKLRYGLEDGYTYTLEEVGKIFKVTRERVRQIEAKAVKKLQHPIRARHLEGFLET